MRDTTEISYYHKALTSCHIRPVNNSNQPCGFTCDKDEGGKEIVHINEFIKSTHKIQVSDSAYEGTLFSRSIYYTARAILSLSPIGTVFETNRH